MSSSIPAEGPPLDAALAPATRTRRGVSMLDAPPSRSSKGASVIAGAGTVFVHIALVSLATWVGAGVALKKGAPPAVTQMVEIELPPPPAAPEPEPAPEPPPEPKPLRAVRAPAPAPEVEKPAEPEAAPPPEAAQAAQVVTAPAEVVDFGNTFVTGNSAKFAGGVTEQGGTSATAVRAANARAGGVPGGTGTDVTADRSRPPRLAGGAVWDCPFPIEADDAGLDHAVVGLRVEVNAAGSVVRADAIKDPGHGFGREARRCAQRKRWAPGIDSAGRPIAASALIKVRFERK